MMNMKIKPLFALITLSLVMQSGFADAGKKKKPAADSIASKLENLLSQDQDLAEEFAEYHIFSDTMNQDWTNLTTAMDALSNPQDLAYAQHLQGDLETVNKTARELAVLTFADTAVHDVSAAARQSAALSDEPLGLASSSSLSLTPSDLKRALWERETANRYRAELKVPGETPQLLAVETANYLKANMPAAMKAELAKLGPAAVKEKLAKLISAKTQEKLAELFPKVPIPTLPSGLTPAILNSDVQANIFAPFYSLSPAVQNETMAQFAGAGTDYKGAQMIRGLSSVFEAQAVSGMTVAQFHQIAPNAFQATPLLSLPRSPTTLDQPAEAIKTFATTVGQGFNLQHPGGGYDNNPALASDPSLLHMESQASLPEIANYASAAYSTDEALVGAIKTTDSTAVSAYHQLQGEVQAGQKMAATDTAQIAANKTTLQNNVTQYQAVTNNLMTNIQGQALDKKLKDNQTHIEKNEAEYLNLKGDTLTKVGLQKKFAALKAELKQAEANEKETPDALWKNYYNNTLEPGVTKAVQQNEQALEKLSDVLVADRTIAASAKTALLSVVDKLKTKAASDAHSLKVQAIAIKNNLLTLNKKNKKTIHTQMLQVQLHNIAMTAQVHQLMQQLEVTQQRYDQPLENSGLHQYMGPDADAVNTNAVNTDSTPKNADGVDLVREHRAMAPLDARTAVVLKGYTNAVNQENQGKH